MRSDGKDQPGDLVTKGDLDIVARRVEEYRIEAMKLAQEVKDTGTAIIDRINELARRISGASDVV